MLIELLRQVAAEAPERPAVISERGATSYGELVARAETIAYGLVAFGIERFGSAVSEPADIVAVLAGASASGSEPCLYPRDVNASSLGALSARFDHETVVADERLALPDGRKTLALKELLAAGEEIAVDPGAPDSAPVLILTTGTTGEQKGARHEWGRLAGSVRRPDQRAGTRWLLAYNLNQFAGVQIMLHVLASGSTLVVPASRRPEDVARALQEHDVTHVSGTPTFWRLVAGHLDRAGASRPALAQLTLGGEAAPEGLIEKLGVLFPEARISHVYAGTEFGSAVSVADGRSGLPLSVLERSESAPVQLRIVDGELQIRSRVGMLGYHQRADDASEWRPTGDLVEVRGDRIQFVGRTSEIINVGGAKVHPLPVEEVVCAVDGVQLAAVYGRPNAITGQLVAVDVVADEDADLDALKDRIRAACEALPAAGRPRRIRFVEQLETRGNKLLRREAEVSR